MRNLILAAALATASIIPAGAAMASQVNVTSAGPVIDLTVTEDVKAKPDIARFTTGVESIAPSANEAIRKNAEQMSAVVAKIKKLGIADKDIQTTQINLSQSYDYVDGHQVFKGYQASNMVMVTLRDLKKLGGFLDAVASDGATNFNGPTFAIDDDTPFKAAAREKAWDNALVLARMHAKKAGYADARVIKVEEGVGPQLYGGERMVAMDAVASRAKETPIAPGEVSTSVTLNFTFEMVK